MRHWSWAGCCSRCLRRPSLPPPALEARTGSGSGAGCATVHAVQKDFRRWIRRPGIVSIHVVVQHCGTFCSHAASAPVQVAVAVPVPLTVPLAQRTVQPHQAMLVVVVMVVVVAAQA